MSSPLLAEVEIRGDLARGAYRSPSGSRLVPVSDVLAQIDSARERGARALLLSVSSLGGDVCAAFAVYDALRSFAHSGGTVVAHVELAGSAAPLFVLGADFIVAAPRNAGAAVFAIHGFHAQQSGGAPDAGDAELAEVLRWGSIALLAFHTLVPPRDAALWTARPYAAQEAVAIGAAFGADRALALGFADAVGSPDDARKTCDHVLAGEPLPRSARRVALEGRTDPTDAARIAARAEALAPVRYVADLVRAAAVFPQE